MVSFMRHVLSSFLKMLCEVCGAEHARMRLAVADEGRAVIILDAKAPTGGKPPGLGGIGGNQIPLIEPSVGPGEAPGHWHDGSHSICGEAAVTEGAILGAGDLREWTISRRLNGFDIELHLALRERGSGFINERILKAAAFLELFVAILDGRHAADGGDAPERGAVPAFNPPLVGKTPAMAELKQTIAAVSLSDISVLIEGESGTGKEVVAHNVHRLSRRHMKPLVIASSYEMPHSLLQSELFGHAEGAFTGASRDRAGLIESASGGTFFLDEIGEMPLALQATLLRTLQEKEIRRLGESRRRNVDVRFIFATNRDLSDLVRRGRFRKDLYF